MRIKRTSAALLLAGVCGATAMVPTAQAVPLSAGGVGGIVYHADMGGQRSANDPGGIDQWIHLIQPGDHPLAYKYSATFWAHGENLHIADLITDGRRAEVEVEVHKGVTSTVIDRDHFWCSYACRHNLGTPDGSGDIAEGNGVRFRIRVEGGRWSPWGGGGA